MPSIASCISLDVQYRSVVKDTSTSKSKVSCKGYSSIKYMIYQVPKTTLYGYTFFHFQQSRETLQQVMLNISRGFQSLEVLVEKKHIEPNQASWSSRGKKKHWCQKSQSELWTEVKQLWHAESMNFTYLSLLPWQVSMNKYLIVTWIVQLGSDAIYSKTWNIHHVK